MNRFVIDAMNLAHRSHNANAGLKSSDGRPTGMFFGFVRAVVSLKKKYRGYRFSAVWDSRPERKLAIKPDYKSGRVHLPQSIGAEIEDVRFFLSHCGIDQYECLGYEADDVIATLVDRWVCENGHVVLYSSDKDLLQLVEDGKVLMHSPKVLGKPEKFYDEEAVKSCFGVYPKNLVLFRCFDGDPSDGLAGVPRIRRKVIASLVSEYKSLEDVYAAVPASRLTKREKSSIIAFKDRVFENMRLMLLDRHVGGIEETPGIVDKAALREILYKNNVKSVDPDAVGDLFESSLMAKYGDPVKTDRIETYSLFDT